MTASRPLPGCSIKELYTFEAPSSTEWSFYKGNLAFQPNVFIDITETLEAKVAAMNLYRSEIRQFPHPRSSDAITAAARRWGSIAGVNAAEAFELMRKIT
jgi:LmbE family N-acetylglucosaminyl deacetylase